MEKSHVTFRNHGFLMTLYRDHQETVEYDNSHRDAPPRSDLQMVEKGEYTRIEITRLDAREPALGTLTFQMRGVPAIVVTDANLPLAKTFPAPVDYGPDAEPLTIRKAWSRGTR